MDFVTGARHDVHADGSRTIGIEDHSSFPVGEWHRVYVPASRLVDVCAALEAIGPPFEVGDWVVNASATRYTIVAATPDAAGHIIGRRAVDNIYCSLLPRALQRDEEPF